MEGPIQIRRAVNQDEFAEAHDLSDGPDQGLAAASDGLFFASPEAGVPAGAGDSDAGGAGAGAGAVGAGAVGAGVVGAGAVGAGAVAGAVGVRGLDTVFLCFGVSGSTKGPF
jgi:hypothetical protein